MSQKLLIIGHTFPEPSTTAAGGRMLQLIELFLEQGFSLSFATTAARSDKSFALGGLSITTSTIELNDPSFDELLRALQPSVVLFDRFITEEQFGWRVAEMCPNAIRILDTEDLHFLRKAREAAYRKGWPISQADLFTQTAKRELASILRCDVSLIISEVEMELLTTTFNTPKGLLFYLPFVIPAEISATTIRQQDSFEDRSNFIAVGNLKHAPNVASVKILKEHIWPILKNKVPEANLYVYGAYAPQQIQALHSPSERFFIKGWAEDIEGVMQNARVQLAPIPFGAGLKGKLLDAMQFGLPSVTTAIGAEGMYGLEEIPGNIEDDWKQFVEAASTLYLQKEDWQKAQRAGYKTLRQRFHKRDFSEAFSAKISILLKDVQDHRNRHFIGQVLQYKTLQATKYLSKWIEEKERKNTSS